MEVVELLKELIKRQSVTPNECGIYEIIKAELADFKAIEIEKNGVKNLFLYKDFSSENSSLGTPCGDFGNLGHFADSSPVSRPKFPKNSTTSTANTRIYLESKADSSDSNESLLLYSTNQTQKTTEEIAVEVLYLEKNLGAKLDLESVSLPNFSPSAKDAPKSKLKNPRDSMPKPHLCFAGHIDVVPAGFGWSVPPFDALIKNGVLYGRGAQDMKGGVAAFVSALQKVKKFNGTLSVLLTSDEEGDGIFGTKIMLECLKERGLLPHFAIVAEPTCEKKLGDSIKIGRRGSVNGVLKIYGTQGHAAYPHKCVNPLDLIAPILAQISSKDLDSGDKYFAPSKIVITDIRGGIEATNVTPAELKLMFNVRNNPLTDKGAIKSYIESLLKSAGIKKYDLSFSQSAFPFVGAESTLDSANLLNILCNAIYKKTHIMPRPNTEGGTSDARYFSAFGVEVVEFGLINDRIHAVDECVNLRDLESLRDIFVDFIVDFDSAIRVPNKHKNSSIVSEFLGLCEVSNDDKTLSMKRTEALPKKSPQEDEF